MRSEYLEFARWLRRMGGKPEVEPELIPSIQPVVVVGDHSGVSPMVDLAWGIGGFQQLAVPGNFSIYELHSRAPGGIVVTAWSVYEAANVFSTDDFEFSWGIVPASGLATSTISMDVNPNRRCRSTHAARSNAASYIGTFSAEAPRYLSGKAKTTTPRLVHGPLPAPLWVPAGRSFVIEGAVAAMSIFGFSYFYELEAPPSR